MRLGETTSEQSSDSQTPKFRQERSKFGAQERELTISLGPGTTQFRCVPSTLTTEYNALQRTDYLAYVYKLLCIITLGLSIRAKLT